MAPKKSSNDSKAEAKALEEGLRDYIRTKGNEYLKDPNVTSIGIGRKNGDGPLSLQFTVGAKFESAIELEAADTEPLPASITLASGIEVPTDVLERTYRASFQVLPPKDINPRKLRCDPIQPGVSISHTSVSAGTVGLIVFDRTTGAPCILSNWHVLHGGAGKIGDDVIQPGKSDDNNWSGNVCGKLLRSHLGNAGDCALATLGGRQFERMVFGFDVVPTQFSRVEIDDAVIKSGRTTGITYGIVRRVDVIAKIDYGFPVGPQFIGGFEIGVDEGNKPGDGEISRGGDSGSVWLIAKDGKATDIVAGLHFGGETSVSTDEHALACYPISVQQKLDFLLEPPARPEVEAAAAEVDRRSGYDAGFLRQPVPLPGLSAAHRRDTVRFEERETIPYTHFSVCLSQSRRMARYAAWNIDGGHIAILPRRAFQLDPRIPAKYQLGNDVYRDNKLDKGHIARRADVVWGTPAEAEQANRDSNFYTNIAPQHERYNQSSRKGLWGNLENLILEQVDVQDVKMSVIAGPIFGDDDVAHRGAHIPEAYWKLVAYVGPDARLRTSAFILSQADLLSDIEAIDLDPFKLYQVTMAELGEQTGLDFSAHAASDTMTHAELAAALREAAAEAAEPAIREIGYLSDLRF